MREGEGEGWGEEREGGGRERKSWEGERERDGQPAEKRIAQMTFWRSGLEVTPKSPRFKSVALFKMQTWQI